ncbi:MAG: MYXO-CTERM sorting domain-containing protein [Polyangiaceae bacterium]
MRFLKSFVSAVILVDSCAPAALAQTPAIVNISVDGTAAGSPLEPIWAFHGYDEVNYTTTTEGQALLQTLGAIPSSPPHIRNHFLLNTGDGVPSFKWGSTNVYTVDATGSPVYDWTLMDGIMDTITGAGALPFAEIGFMPEALSTNPTPYQNSGIYTLDGGCFYPPTDYTKWGDLIQQWATHSNTRYSTAATAWQWELWNEPDIGYWKGTPAEYDELFDYTESALHQVLPNAPLGGPATSGAGSFLTQFLQHCSTGTDAATGATGVRLDMVTFHAKGGVAMVGGNVEMDLGHQLQLHQNGFNIVAGFPRYKQTPIVVSEADPDGCAACPVSQTPADAYRLSPAYGAYVVAMVKHTLELEASIGVNVRGLLTWAFLFQNQPYFAGYRVLSTNGIHLPVLGAFELLGGLSGETIPVTSTGALTLAQVLSGTARQQADVNAMAARNGLQVQVLAWNYHDDIVTVADTPVSLTVQVPDGFGASAAVSHLRVDDNHGDAYTVWVSQGSPAAPSAAQLAALAQAMDPEPLQPTQTVPVTNGSVTLSFDLPRFGISLVTIDPAGASDASAVGTPDSGPAADAGSVGDATVTGPDAATKDASGGSSSGGTGGSSNGGSRVADAATGEAGGSSGGGSASSSGDAAAGQGSGSSSGGSGTVAGASSSGSSSGTMAGSSGGNGDAAPGSTGGGSNGGCGCRVTPSGRSSWPALALLAATVLLRRRRKDGDIPRHSEDR